MGGTERLFRSYSDTIFNLVGKWFQKPSELKLLLLNICFRRGSSLTRASDYLFLKSTFYKALCAEIGCLKKILQQTVQNFLPTRS